MAWGYASMMSMAIHSQNPVSVAGMPDDYYAMIIYRDILFAVPASDEGILKI